MKKNRLMNSFYLKQFYFALIIIIMAPFMLTGCVSNDEGFEDSSALVVIEGSIASGTLAPSLENLTPEGGLKNSKLPAIAKNGDVITLSVNGANESTCQVDNYKFKFTGKFKGKMLSLKIGSYANEAYLGVLSAEAKDTITIPAINEDNIFATEVIRKQKTEGKTKFENFTLSNNQNDMIAVTNRVSGVLSQKFISDRTNYGSNKEELLNKINKSGTFNDSIFSSSAINIFETVSNITISPLTYSLGIKESKEFTVNMTGFINQNVIFKVNGITGGNDTLGKITGTVAGSGYVIAVYTAPDVINSQQQITLSVQSIENPSAVATSLITLTPVTVYVNDGITPVRIDAKNTSSYKFTSTVLGHNNKNVLWQINDMSWGNTQIGYISATGFYTPPGQASSLEKIIVKACSLADPTKYGTCEIILY